MLPSTEARASTSNGTSLSTVTPTNPALGFKPQSAMAPTAGATDREQLFFGAEPEQRRGVFTDPAIPRGTSTADAYRHEADQEGRALAQTAAARPDVRPPSRSKREPSRALTSARRQ